MKTLLAITMLALASCTVTTVTLPDGTVVETTTPSAGTAETAQAIAVFAAQAALEHHSSK